MQERVLEESGLRKDHEYFIQSSYRTEAGDLKRPDVIIRLPDNKDVVVDSKVSLNAYEEALAVDDDQERDALLKQYLMNMKNHVKRLSSQDYDRLEDVRSLDFVLLFVPIESAFTLAMQTDHNLFTEAFSKRIVIVSPTTLMMTLRIMTMNTPGPTARAMIRSPKSLTLTRTGSELMTALCRHRRLPLEGSRPVSYTHLTLPTNREV